MRPPTGKQKGDRASLTTRAGPAFHVRGTCALGFPEHTTPDGGKQFDVDSATLAQGIAVS